MDKILLVGAEVAAVAAALLASYMMLLFYRAPNHAKWLESNAATTAVMVALMTTLIFSVAFLVKGIAGVIADPLASISAAFGLFVVTAWGLWKLLRMSIRLKAAESGHSPFHIADFHPPVRKSRRRAPGAA